MNRLVVEVALVVLVFGCYVSSENVINMYGESVGQSNNFVAFSVGRKLDITAGKDIRLDMDVEFYNDEKHFDMKTDLFTAPIKGIYSFSFGAGSINGKAVHLTLRTGNPEVDRIRTYDLNPKHGHGSATVVLKLEKGDTASIWLYKTHTAHGNVKLPPSTYFTGFLLKSLESSCN